MNFTAYELDIAMRVFQLCWVMYESAYRKFGKHELLEFFTQRETRLCAIKACGSAHWWQRKLMALGHEVKLIHAKFVGPFVQGTR